MRTARMMVAMILVLVWTSTAAAECAWVLWSQGSFSNVNRPKMATVWWDVEGAYQSFEDCTAGRDRLASRAARMPRCRASSPATRQGPAPQARSRPPRARGANRGGNRTMQRPSEEEAIEQRPGELRREPMPRERRGLRSSSGPRWARGPMLTGIGTRGGRPWQL